VFSVGIGHHTGIDVRVLRCSQDISNVRRWCFRNARKRSGIALPPTSRM
jgi:hypothetical protein